MQEFLDSVLTFGARCGLAVIFAVIALTSLAIVYATYLFWLWVIYFIKATLGV